MTQKNTQRLVLIAFVLFNLLACSLFTPDGNIGEPTSVNPGSGGGVSQPTAIVTVPNDPPVATIQPGPAGTSIAPTSGNILSCVPSRDLKPTQDSLGDPYYPPLGNGGYDAQHYTLEINADAKKNSLEGRATIDLQASQELKSFNLDFRGLQVQSVTVNGQPAETQRKDPELTITPANPIPSGEKFQVVVNYSGTPKPVDEGVGIILGWNQYEGGTYVASEPAGAMTWYPVSDHPCDKATYTFRVTVPEPYVVAANGLLKQTIDNGNNRTYVWEESYPMASYLATVNIAQFTEQTQQGPNGLTIRNYFQQDIQNQMARYFSKTPDMIEFYSSIFGPYPFEAYGVVVVGANLGFALETQTMSLFGKASLQSQDRAQTVPAHELAHQWFGDSVSLKNWKDIWLNEGFATYASWLWLEHLDGRSVLNQQAREWYQQLASMNREPPPGDPAPDNLFTTSVYFRGALTLHALRLKVGDDVFFKILRTYADRYRYGNASTQDFIRLAEEVSQQDLKSFFQGWLYEKQMPAIPEMRLKSTP